MGKGYFRDLFEYQLGHLPKLQLYNATKDNIDFIRRFKLGKKLSVHNGCVNTICWSDNGQLLLSGSDDRNLIITDAYNDKIQYKVLSGHHANIFSAKFLPNSSEKKIVSCSGDGMIAFTDVENSETAMGYNYNSFDCHFGTVYQVVVVPGDSNSFLTCGEDGTVRWFDLRVKNRCTKNDCTEDVLINCRRAVTSLAVNPVLPWQLAVGCADGTVVLYDRRKLTTKATGGTSSRSIQAMLSRFSAPSVDGRNLRITSLTYSHDAEEVLVSYSTDHVYLFNIKDDIKPKKLSYRSEVGGASNENGDVEEGGTKPPLKRLRLRGDWSDTGPNAVPERERGRAQVGNTAQNVMQRMSDMLTRWLEDAANQLDANESQPDQNEAEATDNHIQNESTTNEASSSDRQATLENEQVAKNELEEVKKLDFSTINVGASTSAKNETASKEEIVSDESSTLISGVRSQSVSVSFPSTEICAPSAQAETRSQKERPNGNEKNINENIPDTKQYNDGNTSDTDAGDTSNESVIKGHENKNTHQRLEAASSSNTEQPGISNEESDIQVLHRMVDTLKSQSLEPTVSLKYYSQGASTSQIKFSFPQRPSTQDSSRPGNDSSVGIPQRTVEAHATAETIQSEDMGTEVREQQDITSNSTSQMKRDDNENACIANAEVKDDSGSKTSYAKNNASSSDSTKEAISRTAHGDSDETEEEEDIQLEAGALASETSSGEKARPELDLSKAATRSREGEDGNSSDSDVDTSPVMRTGAGGSSRHSALRSIEQNLAARRLQRVFRRRQEQSAQQEEEEMNLPKPGVKQTYRGHRNARTMIKQANFWGRNYVLSGSDCGHVFMWDRQSARLVMLLEADAHVVNCVQPHPYDPILATSGIDYDIKLWGPFAPECCFESKRAEEIMERNKIMLEETKDTLTVPATFMLRMLASINRVRAARRGNFESDSSSEHDD